MQSQKVAEEQEVLATTHLHTSASILHPVTIETRAAVTPAPISCKLRSQFGAAASPLLQGTKEADKKRSLQTTKEKKTLTCSHTFSQRAPAAEQTQADTVN